MDNENKENLCYRCVWFDRYYTQGTKQMNLTKYGWCSKMQSHIRSNGACEHFQHKRRPNKAYMGVKNCLNGLLTEISELRKYIEADKKEEKQNESL